MTKKAEVSSQLEGVETDLVNVRHCVCQLEHISDASDQVDQLEWKLEMLQRDMQAARAKEYRLRRITRN